MNFYGLLSNNKVRLKYERKSLEDHDQCYRSGAQILKTPCLVVGACFLQPFAVIPGSYSLARSTSCFSCAGSFINTFI